jgi:TolB-like protein
MPGGMKLTRIVVNLLILALLFLAACTKLYEFNFSSPSGKDEKSTQALETDPRGRSTLAVLKFINTSSKRNADLYRPWEYGIASMLTTDLEETSMFNMIDRVRLNDILREHELQKAGLTNPATALSIGKLVTARYILTGSFLVAKQDLRIDVQVFSVEKGILLGAASSTGKVDKFFLVEKDAFNKVTRVLKLMLDEEKKAKIMSSIETKSVDASLRNYSGEAALLEADELKKTGKNKEAVGLLEYANNMFNEALKYDQSFDKAKVNIFKVFDAIITYPIFDSSLKEYWMKLIKTLPAPALTDQRNTMQFVQNRDKVKDAVVLALTEKGFQTENNEIFIKGVKKDQDGNKTITLTMDCFLMDTSGGGTTLRTTATKEVYETTTHMKVFWLLFIPIPYGSYTTGAIVAADTIDDKDFYATFFDGVKRNLAQSSPTAKTKKSR